LFRFPSSQVSAHQSHCCRITYSLGVATVPRIFVSLVTCFHTIPWHYSAIAQAGGKDQLTCGAPRLQEACANWYVELRLIVVYDDYSSRARFPRHFRLDAKFARASMIEHHLAIVNVQDPLQLRVEAVLKTGLVGGELVDDAAAGGIPQKGDVFISCRCGSYPVSCLIVSFALWARTSTKKVGKPKVTRWCKSSSTPRTISPSLDVWRVGYLPGPTQSSSS
jgi:hypothetical protein